MSLTAAIGKSLVSLGARLWGKRVTSGGEWPEGSASAFMDALGVVRTPRASDLVREFSGVAYACVQINALAVAAVPVKLFVQTRAGEPRAKCRTRPAAASTIQRLMATKHLRQRLSKAVLIEEVEAHPFLDVLDAGGYQLKVHLVEYLDVVGQAFLWPRGVEGGPLAGMPARLDILPAHEVAPKQGQTIDTALAGWKWGRNEFAPDDLVWFRWPSLSQPYTGCQSPVGAAWTQIIMGDKSASRIINALEKSPDVSFLVSPAGGATAPVEAFGTAPLTRLEHQLKQRLLVRRDSIVVAGIPLNVASFAMDARQLELAAQRGLSREEVAICIGVPPAMLTVNTNLDNLKAARAQHAKNAVEPRCILIDQTINAELLPRYDPTGRLFLAHDDCVPADVATDVLRETADLNNGARTINEIREERNLDPVPWGEEPWIPSGKRQPSEERPSPLGAFPPSDRPSPSGRGEGEGGSQEAPRSPQDESSGGDEASDTNRPAKSQPRPRHACPAACKHDVRVHGGLSAGARGDAPAGSSAVDPSTVKQVAPSPEGNAENPAINIHGLPDGRALLAPLQRVIKRQRKAILKAIQTRPEAALKAVQTANQANHANQKDPISADPIRTIRPIRGSKALADLPGIDWDEWDDDFRKSCAPVLEIYAENGARAANARLAATDEEAAWRVQLPQVREAVDQAAMQFAESTNATTSMQIDDAIAKLKADLTEGILSEENTVRELTKRVQAIFTGLERDRARLIAQTEASRAVHQGQLIAAEQSGMVVGFRWLAHPGACDACAELDGQSVDLGDAFADDGRGTAYSVVTAPPLHPNCLCSVTEDLKPLGELLAEADELGEGFRPEE